MGFTGLNIRTWKIVFITIAIWLVGVGLYAYVSVTTVLSQPDIASYERSVGFQLIGLAFTVLPVFVIGLMVLVLAELIVGELAPQKQCR